ncbi:MAG TPA: SAM-dependent methyltransferase [Chlamydiales bacterium]|nr:SAM-dependent methyltransferase [Chlamydiales bacterium]
MRTGYLAPVGLEEALLGELKEVESQVGRLIIARGEAQPVHWALNIWRDLQIIPFDSIGDAAQKLRALHGLWAFFPHEHIRRAHLIQEKLPYFSPKPLPFPATLPKGTLGSWTLLDANTLIASASCTSPVPHGEYQFLETKEPPSRAYLKLWEALTRLGCMPKPGDVCLEIGASPGSWTYVLSSLGAKVIAVDRAPLERNFPNVRFLKQDAFQLHPKDFEQVTWVFSDVICYPEKLLSWIQLWLDQGSKARFVCTLKFQGADGYGVIAEFEKIPGCKILHLSHNKHELTFMV